MHVFYRNRLVRAFLRPSRIQDFHSLPIADFSPADDLAMAGILTNPSYDGPLPIFNCTLSLLSSKDLFWQERKGCSFSFTPLFSGFDTYPGTIRVGYNPGAYVNTEAYAQQWDEPLTLGAAMALSGAALTPHFGKGSSRPAAFLMTMLNLRLGRWLPNPWRADADRLPRHRLLTLIREILGLTTSLGDYVYVTDGGHFDNLAIYELLRRRCATVVAVDGGEDKGLSCTDLATAIEKCRTDFGAEIELNVKQMREELARQGWTSTRIRYSGETQPAEGRFVYIKACLVGNESLDVQVYKSRNAAFPHHSTTNQWFGETQFESYRMLGEIRVRGTIQSLECADETRDTPGN
jgi:hypothetical protein